MNTPSRYRPPRWREWPYLTKTVIFLSLIGLFFLVQWVVHTFQKPGHMGIIESQSMDMTMVPPEGAMPVETETVKRAVFSGTVTYTGNAVAYNDIAVFPRTEGWIVRMPVYPGDRVRKGQILAQLDMKELTSRVREAQFGQQAEQKAYQASLQATAQSRAELDKVQRAIQSAKANLNYWQNEIQRARTLAQDEVITVEELQREQSQYEAAQSQYYQALAQYQAAQKGASASALQAQAQLAKAQQAQANQRTQEIIRSYTAVVAQQDGVITKRNVSPGTLVNPATQVLQMAQISPMRIQANVAESDFNQIHVGSDVQIWNRKEDASKPITAKVTAIFPAANLQTRTAIVEAIIPNEDERFVPGDYAIMAIRTGKAHEALSVATSALTTVGDQTSVWVVKEGKVQRRYVTTGTSNNTRTEIVQGLHAGEVVVTRGTSNLADGMEITEAQYGPSGLMAMPKVTSSRRLSAENGYRLNQKVGDQTLAVQWVTQPAKVGNNRFIVEIISSMPGMYMGPSNPGLEVVPVMSAMPAMPVSPPTIRQSAQGKFDVTVNFNMSGLWILDMTLKSGSQTIGKTQVEVEVME